MTPAGAPIRFIRRGAFARDAITAVRSDDGAFHWRAETKGDAFAADVVFVDAYSGVVQFAVHPKRRILNSKYDVLDSDGGVIGRLRRHMSDGDRHWTLADRAGEASVVLAEPDPVLGRFLKRATGDGTPYAFVRGRVPIASLARERRPRRFTRGPARFAHALRPPRDFVLRLEPDSLDGLDARLVIAAALMMQDLTIGGAAATACPAPRDGFVASLMRFRPNAKS